jgi:hypothetical protein
MQTALPDRFLERRSERGVFGWRLGPALFLGEKLTALGLHESRVTSRLVDFP